jgi:hypothetical protein
MVAAAGAAPDLVRTISLSLDEAAYFFSATAGQVPPFFAEGRSQDLGAEAGARVSLLARGLLADDGTALRATDITAGLLRAAAGLAVVLRVERRVPGGVERVWYGVDGEGAIRCRMLPLGRCELTHLPAADLGVWIARDAALQAERAGLGQLMVDLPPVDYCEFMVDVGRKPDVAREALVARGADREAAGRVVASLAKGGPQVTVGVFRPSAGELSRVEVGAASWFDLGQVGLLAVELLSDTEPAGGVVRLSATTDEVAFRRLVALLTGTGRRS